MEYENKTIEKSYCCEADVRFSKGSYMGEYHSVCCSCNRYCKYYLKEIKIPVKPKHHAFSRYNPNEFKP